MRWTIQSPEEPTWLLEANHHDPGGVNKPFVVHQDFVVILFYFDYIPQFYHDRWRMTRRVL